MRFARGDLRRRDRIVSLLRAQGIDVRRTTVEDVGGQIYLVRSGAGVASARETIVELLDTQAPGWESDVVFYWPE
jgi:hypothetical protein